jgi:thioredoxin 1
MVRVFNIRIQTKINEMAGKAIEINDANFKELIASDKPVLVDFWAEWCGPCKMIGPVVEEIAGEYEGKATVGKMDVDANSATPMEFGIRSIPTLMIFKNGEMVDKIVGAVPKHVLTQKLEAAM